MVYAYCNTIFAMWHMLAKGLAASCVRPRRKRGAHNRESRGPWSCPCNRRVGCSTH
jgi:hypothetical protein